MSGEDMEPVIILLGREERVLHEDREVKIVEEVDREVVIYRDGDGFFHVKADSGIAGLYTTMIELEG